MQIHMRFTYSLKEDKKDESEEQEPHGGDDEKHASKQASKNGDRMATSSSRDFAESATKENYELHQTSIPDRQGPTNSVSPNHHGHRSRSHNDKSDKV